MIQFTQASGALTVARKERNMVVTWKKLTPEQIERYRAQKRAYMAVYRAEKAETVRNQRNAGPTQIGHTFARNGASGSTGMTPSRLCCHRRRPLVGVCR